MSSSQTPRPSIILKDKNGRRVLREYPPIITQRRSSQFSQQSHQKNQYNNNIIDSISRINANAQQRDRLLNHQVYQSNNHIDRSPAVTNNDSRTNCGPSNKENLPPNLQKMINALRCSYLNFEKERLGCNNRRRLCLDRNQPCNNGRLCLNRSRSNACNGRLNGKRTTMTGGFA